MEQTGQYRNIDLNLNQLMEERKQEKRKELKKKLKEKLKIISDRRTSGIEKKPFPTGAFERIKSNDIWGSILDYMSDPTDITDTYFACKTFAEILEERRMLMILPKVLDFYKEKVEDALEVRDCKDGNICYQTWNKLCLATRGVSKSCKKIVDSHSNDAKDYWFLTTEWMDQDSPIKGNVVIFDDEESVDRASESLIRRGFTISPIQYLAIDIDDRISEAYYRKLMEYLKCHGSSVRFLYLAFDFSGDIASGFFETLCGSMVKYMQNLEGLNIVFCHHSADDNEIPQLGQVHIQFEEELNQPDPEPFPTLTSLKYFSCCEWGMNESLISQILTKCTNLTTVNLVDSAPGEEETTEALMALTIDRFIGLPTIIIQNPVTWTWPLEHLEITAGTEMEMNASVLFPVINRFKDTLKYLYIFKLVNMDVRLELFNLTAFFISSIRRGTLGFDDLLPLKSLEKIRLETPRSVEFEDENALVKVKPYLESGEMHQSNIWACFSTLQRFQVQLDCTYTRPWLYSSRILGTGTAKTSSEV